MAALVETCPEAGFDNYIGLLIGLGLSRPFVFIYGLTPRGFFFTDSVYFPSFGEIWEERPRLAPMALFELTGLADPALFGFAMVLILLTGSFFEVEEDC